MKLLAYNICLNLYYSPLLWRVIFGLALGFTLSLLLPACSGDRHSIVLYCAHDRQLAEPVIQSFEQLSGIRVKTVYDTDANKSVGLTKRILAAQDQPRADLFWNTEVSQTLLLAQQGALARNPREIAAVADTTEEADDIESHWVSFAARARIIIANTDLVSKFNPPSRIQDLADPRWHNKAAFANPHLGTTGTHFAALYALWGAERFRDWIQALKDHRIAMLSGNAQVKNDVAAGVYIWGLTDTDEFNEASLAGRPVKMIVPDQIPDGLGVFIIPNTISILKDAPHPMLARGFMQYLLSAEVETRLARGHSAQIPVRNSVAGPKLWPPANRVRKMQVTPAQIVDSLQPMLEIFDAVWSGHPS